MRGQVGTSVSLDGGEEIGWNGRAAKGVIGVFMIILHPPTPPPPPTVPFYPLSIDSVTDVSLNELIQQASLANGVLVHLLARKKVSE